MSNIEELWRFEYEPATLGPAPGCWRSREVWTRAQVCAAELWPFCSSPCTELRRCLRETTGPQGQNQTWCMLSLLDTSLPSGSLSGSEMASSVSQPVWSVGDSVQFWYFSLYTQFSMKQNLKNMKQNRLEQFRRQTASVLACFNKHPNPDAQSFEISSVRLVPGDPKRAELIGI